MTILAISWRRFVQDGYDREVPNKISPEYILLMAA
jgi:hypothetical protein